MVLPPPATFERHWRLGLSGRHLYATAASTGAMAWQLTAGWNRRFLPRRLHTC